MAAKPRLRFPETLHSCMPMGSERVRRLEELHAPVMLSSRVEPGETIFVMEFTTAVPQGGLPFLVWYGDCRGCNHHIYLGRYSIPILTACARVDCPLALPIPNDQLAVINAPSSSAWNAVVQQQQHVDYPWSSKGPPLGLESITYARATGPTQRLAPSRHWLGKLPRRRKHWNASLVPRLPMADMMRYRVYSPCRMSMPGGLHISCACQGATRLCRTRLPRLATLAALFTDPGRLV